MIYEKHEHAVLQCLFGIFGNEEPRRTLRTVAPSAKFIVADIGCGFGLRYTGHVLYALARADIVDTVVHAVDPALLTHGTHVVIEELKKCFPQTDFFRHPYEWDQKRITKKANRLHLAIAIQSTPLMEDEKFARLHADLWDMLVQNGVFIDISELKDEVTDIWAYEDMPVYSRSHDERMLVAREHGFEALCSVNHPAHATSTPDGHMMLGIAYRKK